MIVSTTSSGSSKNRKTLFAVLAIVLLTIGTLSGFLLISRPVIFQSDAWDCGKYVFALSQTGVVTVVNNSTKNEPVQRAQVFIDNVLVTTLDVPAVPQGGQATLGNVQAPTKTFTWQVKGTSDCQNAGRYEIASVSYQCKLIQATTTTGSALTAANMSDLNVGDVVRFVVVGSGVPSDYTAARMTINGTLQSETTTRVAGSNNLYQDYTIPAGVTSFTVSAELKAVDGKWY